MTADELKLQLLRDQGQREVVFTLIENLEPEIKRIMKEGPDGSEQDNIVVQGVCAAILAEYQRYKIQILLEGTEFDV